MNLESSLRPGTLRARLKAALAALALALLAVPTAQADYLSTLLSQAPVGYWRLEETVQPQPNIVTAKNQGSLGTAGDGSYLKGVNKGQPGALGGGSTATSSGFSNPGFQVTFLGSSVDVPFDPSLNPNGPFAVEFWAQPSAAPDDLFAPLASLDITTGRMGYLFYAGADTPGGVPHWQFRVGDNTGYTGTAIGGAVTAKAWHHIVGVYDGTQVVLYVNGVSVATVPAPSFAPNATKPFRIGGTTIPNRGWDGQLQEVAFYPHTLSAADVTAHYNKGLSDGNGYPALVLAGGPVGYWRLGEAADPALPVAANQGTLGAAGNGGYVYGSNPGQSGPSGAAFPGFPAGNKAVGLNGTQGFVTLPALHLNTNSITLSAWVFADGVQGVNSGIVFTRTDNTVAGLKFDQSDPNGLAYNWNDVAAAANFKSSLVVPQGKWSFVALTINPDVAVLTLHDGTTFSHIVNFDAPNIVLPFEGVWHIGNDPGDESVTFKGSIDEVAIFNRALSLGELFTQYASAVGGIAAQIFADPESPANVISVGEPITLTVDAGGTPPLSYQWRLGGAPIAGATGPTYTKASAALGDSGNYDVVVSNAFGSPTTSQAATVQVVQLTAPAITTQPVGRTLFPGGSDTLSVIATGGRLSYQWKKGANPVTGATNASLSLGPVSGADSGSYTVVVSNSLGSLPSDPAVVTVVVPAAGSYEAAIVADAPEAWWRLGEAPGSTVLLDSLGRHDGTYVGNGVTPGGPGVLHSGAGTSATFDGTASYARVPFSSVLNPRTNFTAEAWVKTTSSGVELSPFSSMSLSGGSGRGYGFLKTSGDTWWGITGNADNNNFYYLDMGDVTPARWSHLVIVGDASGVSFYFNGEFVDGPFSSYVRNVSAPLLIGARNNDGAIHQFWDGQVAEVAFYAKPLTGDQIHAHYVAALYGSDTAPLFLTQPVSQTAAVGQQVTFSPVVEGSEPLNFQWTRNAVAIPLATNVTLTVTNLDFSDAAAYRLVAGNPVGNATSAPAALTVVAVPVFANITNDLVVHLKFDTNFKDSSGRGNHATAVGVPTLVTGRIGKQALHYSTDAMNSDYNYLDLGQPTDLQFGTSVNFSVAYWVRLPKGSLSGDLPFLCNAQNSYSNPGYTFAPSYQLGGWSWSLGGADIYGPDGSINDGEWHHLIHTFDRTGQGITYLDGEKVDTRPVTASGDLDTGDSTSIGQDPTGTYSESGSADLDDLGIWRRVLTPFEAWSIWHVGKEYGLSFDSTTGTPTLSLRAQADGSQEIIWSGGVLQSSDKIAGPWTNVPGATTAPYTLPTTGTGLFYRASN